MCLDKGRTYHYQTHLESEKKKKRKEKRELRYKTPCSSGTLVYQVMFVTHVGMRRVQPSVFIQTRHQHQINSKSNKKN